MDKIKKSVIVVGIFLILLALPAIVQAEDAGCCCNLLGEADPITVELPDQCRAPYFYNHLETDLGFTSVEIPQLIQVEGKQCDYFCSAGAIELPPEIIIAPCDRADYNPAPTDFSITPEKGELAVSLIWNYECKPDYYDVYRCEGVGCNPETEGYLLRTMLTTTYYRDTAGISYEDGSAPALKWKTDYTYAAVAAYSRGGDAGFSMSGTTEEISTGDVECFKQYSSDMFCVSSLFYNVPFIQEYLEENGYPGIDEYNSGGYFSSNYEDAIWASFGTSKFNKAFSCNANNHVSNGMNICGGAGGGVCAIDDGQPACLAQSNCEVGVEEGNYFGLYYTRDACEGVTGDKRFCFLDKSKSIVDDCYQCSMNMNCYDYRTNDACLSDNCGVGYCEWADIYPALGIGTCYDPRYSACHLCDAEPQLGIGSYESYDNVFEKCDLRKSNSLSTDDFPCFFLNGESKSCGDVTCSDYQSPALCTGDGETFKVRLASDNSLTEESQDTCRIGVCEWMAGVCSKNYNADEFPDCTQTNQNEKHKCALDYFPPSTDMVPVGSFGIYNEIHVNIYDQVYYFEDERRVSGSSNYKTYFCIGTAAAECEIGPNSFLTTSDLLTIHNLELMEGQGDAITNLSVGTNHIKYYTEDPSKNLGVIKFFEIYACQSCTGPSIVNTYIDEAVESEGMYYTSSTNPEIHVDFNIPANPLSTSIFDLSNNLASETRFLSVNSERMNYTFIPETPLAEGEYALVLMADDDEGVIMRNELVFSFVVDYSAGDITMLINDEDAEGQLLTKSTADSIDIIFDEPVTTFSIDYNGRDITESFTQQDDTTFTASSVYFEDGVLLLTAYGIDYAGNEVLKSVEFEVNGQPPDIWLIEPSYGVSEKTTFPLIFGTYNNVDCRYIFNAPIDPLNLPNFGGLSRFDTTGQRSHEKIPFTSISGEANEGVVYEIYVFCNDELHGLAYETFELSFDLTNPTIVNAIAFPKIISGQIEENTFQTKLTVVTDEETFCRYSPNAGAVGEDIDQEFPNYGIIARETNSVFVQVSEDLSSYSFAVICEDLAGRQTQKEIITFSTDSNQEFTLKTKTEGYFNTQDVLLSIESSKRANCLYGTAEDRVNEFFQESEGYIHSTFLMGLGEGEHTYYVRCDNIYREFKEETAFAEITFTVDTTPPKMLWVNDTGPILLEPDFTYFTDHLVGKWVGEDASSGVSQYTYLIESRYAHEAVKNWTESSPDPLASYVTENVVGLELAHDTTYWFIVTPTDAAGNTGQPLTSDGITVDITKKPAHCENGIFDVGALETDLDCGGECPQCFEGMACLEDLDCESMYCDTGFCAAPSCEDGFSNGMETGLDCGGTDCMPCAEGSYCMDNLDCDTGYCINGVCSPEDECYNDIFDVTETDIDCGGTCSARCEEGQSCETGFDCFTGVQCLDLTCTFCAEDDLDCDGIPNSEDSDIDNDGIPNWEDPDDDNDGLCDTADSPLNDPAICEGEDTDDDNDGTPDSDETEESTEWCYLPSEGRAVAGSCDKLGIQTVQGDESDTDGDGIPNYLDDDIDGDGIVNSEDDDVDGDGILNSEDDDIDGDGIPNSKDQDVDGDGQINYLDDDIDGDGILNEQDDDMDGDGVSNSQDSDVDGDGVSNSNDADIDNDGIPNYLDDDMDGDGISNDLDDDIDGDGIANDKDATPESKFRGDQGDIDNDGIPNYLDDDIDGDGIANSEDDDVDGDGILNSEDDDVDGDGIPNSKDRDIDGDGMLNNLDDDMDGDGISNKKDDDMDGDGISNEQDLDIDGDGIPNSSDYDIDGDGEMNYLDDDMDGDGIPNDIDTTPQGQLGQFVADGDLDNDGIPNFLDDDIDGDGIPNDQDPDDDNDGIPDAQDSDKDGDGIPDREEDNDFDGMPNDWELANGLDPDNPMDAYEDADGDGLSNYEEYLMEKEWGQSTDPYTADTDGDGWTDKEEADMGFNPVDPNDHPESTWWIWLVLVLVILILAVGGFFGYNAYTVYQKKKGIAPRAVSKMPKPFVPKPAKIKITAPRPRVIKTKEIIKKEKERTTKFEKLRGILKKKEVVKKTDVKTADPLMKKDWVSLQEVNVKPMPQAPPVKLKLQVSPTFKKLQTLKRGKFGKIKGGQVLRKLMIRVGKPPAKEEERPKAHTLALFDKIRELKKSSPVRPKIILKPHLGKEMPAMPKSGEMPVKPAEKIELPLARTPAEAKKQAIAMNAFDKLRVVVQHKDTSRNVPLKHYTSAEREKMMERLLLLKTGKLESKGKKELFRKLKITSQSKKEKGTIEKGDAKK